MKQILLIHIFLSLVALAPVNTTDDACFLTCETCSGPADTDCLTCEEGFYLIKDLGMCVKDCAKYNYFTDQNKQKCKGCHKSCQTCTSYKIDGCLTCKPGLILSNGMCDIVCHTENPGYPYKGKCRDCHKSCGKCTGSKQTDCTACISPFSFNPNMGTCKFNATLAKLMGRQVPLTWKDIMLYIAIGIIVLLLIKGIYTLGMKWYMHHQASIDRDHTAFVEHDLNIEQELELKQWEIESAQDINWKKVNDIFQIEFTQSDGWRHCLSDTGFTCEAFIKYFEFEIMYNPANPEAQIIVGLATKDALGGTSIPNLLETKVLGEGVQDTGTDIVAFFGKDRLLIRNDHTPKTLPFEFREFGQSLGLGIMFDPKAEKEQTTVLLEICKDGEFFDFKKYDEDLQTINSKAPINHKDTLPLPNSDPINIFLPRKALSEYFFFVAADKPCIVNCNIGGNRFR